MNSQREQDATMIAAIEASRQIMQQCLLPDPATGRIMFDEEKCAGMLLSFSNELSQQYIGLAHTYKHLLDRWGAVTKALNKHYPGENEPGEDAIKMTLRLLKWGKEARESLNGWGKITEYLSRTRLFDQDIQLGQRVYDVLPDLLEKLGRFRAAVEQERALPWANSH